MLSVSSIPAFNDNYIWLLKNDDNHCVVVDPGDAKPVVETLSNLGLTLDAILITHHHSDHVGGVPSLKAAFPSAAVYGPATERFPDVTHPLKDNDTFTLNNTTFRILHVAGHTLDHIAYYADGMLFCGDTLFSGGCGRLFEGSPAQMLHSLSAFSALPDNTQVFCAHEYTESNLKFAQAIEPNNTELNQYVAEVANWRSQGKSSIPSSIVREKAINPFLRAHHPSVKEGVKNRAKDRSDLETFTALRRWKDEF
ncbi:hydroxyacylglutathione hydrolase [Enterovibrio norvegicus]|uniref:Hydroxyacylglutathione hydrolase n=1 Tax=Enterovibrio norvegicus TaxID=188144 RepID=A0ABV4LAA8_9GAMM|nr:hydroxyacylglutathione hydrolase [Enterovibrio norvegicus]OEF58979.1 hydroxyacylglutathione hydrolase [Enterovibrio norvegicus]